MATKTPAKKSGPKDRSYVNKTQRYEVQHESKRKTPAKSFGTRKKS